MNKNIVILAAFLSSVPAAASLPIPVSKTCPIGGEKFEYYETAAYTVFGQRPDGKPYGTWEFPNPLPICPSNKLVVFDEFAPDETSKLEIIITSPDYQEIKETQTSYYRAYSLASQLDRPPQQLRNLLYQAIWETDEKDERRSVYFEAYLELAEDLQPGPVSLEKAWQEMRNINAHRELAQFDVAQARLQQLSDAEIQAKPSSDEEFDDNFKYFRSYAKKMKAVISNKDKSMEPKSLVPKRKAPSDY